MASFESSIAACLKKYIKAVATIISWLLFDRTAKNDQILIFLAGCKLVQNDLRKLLRKNE